MADPRLDSGCSAWLKQKPTRKTTADTLETSVSAIQTKGREAKGRAGNCYERRMDLTSRQLLRAERARRTRCVRSLRGECWEHLCARRRQRFQVSAGGPCDPRIIVFWVEAELSLVHFFTQPLRKK